MVDLCRGRECAAESRGSRGWLLRCNDWGDGARIRCTEGMAARPARAVAAALGVGAPVRQRRARARAAPRHAARERHLRRARPRDDRPVVAARPDPRDRPGGAARRAGAGDLREPGRRGRAAAVGHHGAHRDPRRPARGRAGRSGRARRGRGRDRRAPGRRAGRAQRALRPRLLRARLAHATSGPRRCRRSCARCGRRAGW